MSGREGNPGHASIRASAGSGKTFVLSQRFIALLARGVPVERITALTFSRKAAREIFESVIEHLATAACGDHEAQRASNHIGLDLSQGEFGAILCRLLRSLHRLRVGTIDSFITSILRLFPEHFAVPPDFTLFDSGGEEARKVHGQALRRLLAGRPEEMELFARAFSQATAGRHEKTLGRILERKLMGSQEIYRSAPDCGRWGGGWAEDIAGARDSTSPAAAAEFLTGHPGIAELPERARRRWCDFAAAAAGYSAGSSWTGELSYLFLKLTAARSALREGRASIAVERSTLTLEGPLRQAVLTLVQNVVDRDVATAVERSRGLCRLLEAYDREYSHVVRNEGRFSFSDAVAFVAGEGSLSPSVMKRREGHLYIEYRLDAKLDHWLIDEFQDTSRRQWDVFANLADEILQSRDGERTFFVVGDAKQAIYGWRGGDAALHGEFTERYGEQLEKIRLSRSFRSCPAVIVAVNLIFGSVAESGLPPETAAAWQDLWREHTSGGEAAEKTGAAMIVEPAARDVKVTEEDRLRLTARILEETVSGRDDRTVGILVRTNGRVGRVGEYLRRHCPSVPVECDGPAAILDSLAVGMVLSLVRVAFHPGDRASLAHILMSPLAGGLPQETADGGLATALLRKIRSEGFPAFVTHWTEKIADAFPLDDFERRRIVQLQTAALRFAARGGREGDEFCAFVEGLRLREAGGGAKVRIMTVHQSKGLDFDIVILPDLQDWGSMDKAKPEEITLGRGVDGEVSWVMNTLRRPVAAWDDRLDAAARKRDAESALQELSLLYVAATRARSGLYLVTGFAGPTARALTPAAFVKNMLSVDEDDGAGLSCSFAGETFPVLFLRGDKQWHGGARGAAPGPQPVATPAGRPTLQAEQLERISPSSKEESVFEAEWLFGASSRRALQFGNAVHSLFQMVRGPDADDPDGIVRRWRAETNTPEDFRAEAEAHFRHALESDAIRAALAAGEGCTGLWREKTFDVVLGSSWLSGIFDRVEIFDDGGGRGKRARITDFKSDVITGHGGLAAALRRYRGQMELYGEALAVILGLDPTEVSLRIIFTGPGVVCDIMGAGNDLSWTLRGSPWQAEEPEGERG